ncbi:MAG TPA: hypothetical protein VGS03_01870 [Candidatus Polarisedimenticolia bacterium]|jgi:hypothetical protein|nr:hypothetical protein [Candidatus Polarisedimenticolia bacterium]
MPRLRRISTLVPSFATATIALFFAAPALAQAPAAAPAIREPEPAIRWQHVLSPQATVEVDVPAGWEVVEPADAGGPTRFVPVDGTHCDVVVDFGLASDTQPPIASTEALRALVDAEARDFLDQAVESHYTLRELRGPETSGYYYALRDRAPRKKGAAFLQSGALLVRTAVIRFRIETPKPDLPAIRQALKMLAGSRLLLLAPAPDDSASAPTGSTVSRR